MSEHSFHVITKQLFLDVGKVESYLLYESQDILNYGMEKDSDMFVHVLNFRSNYQIGRLPKLIFLAPAVITESEEESGRDVSRRSEELKIKAPR